MTAAGDRAHAHADAVAVAVAVAVAREAVHYLAVLDGFAAQGADPHAVARACRPRTCAGRPRAAAHGRRQAERSARMEEVSMLSVWPVAQQTAREQRRGRYLPASTAHPGKMLPELARTIIRAYSDPGELVLDPMCGIGTTLVEAIHLDRDAIGVELEPRWAALAAGNAGLAREQGAPAHALCLQGDARRLGRGLLDELAGEAALILSSPPYGPSLHGQVKAGHGRPVEKWDDRYSRNRDNLASAEPCPYQPPDPVAV